ncbi:hypothetical protein V3851_04355 [Paenibacillus sp. M1]|uniref:Uncharacterized protein n=1 Tax=Paenibacillus haidiansis TaxID=1574488 RepID=A0ABU7VQ79_9BACL
MSLKRAKTHWVWSEIAQEINPEQIAGRPVTDLYPKYGREAPEEWYTRGYIVDKEDYVGQTDLFDYVEG